MLHDKAPTSLTYLLTYFISPLSYQMLTRNSSGDEIANVNFLYDDIVHAVKTQ